MSVPDPLAIATRNAHKLREIARICSAWPTTWVTVRSDPSLPWPDVEETGATYLDNALLKARATAEALGISAVADDSGIEVDALGGEPGPRSARYAGDGATDEDNLRQMVRAIKGVPSSGGPPGTAASPPSPGPTAARCTSRPPAKGCSHPNPGATRGSGTTPSSCLRVGTRRSRS